MKKQKHTSIDTFCMAIMDVNDIMLIGKHSDLIKLWHNIIMKILFQYKTISKV